MYGPVQYQSTHFDGITPLGNKPWIFQVNNPSYGHTGPAILYLDSTSGTNVSRDTEFSLSDGLIGNKNEEQDNVANGPSLLLKWVSLKFKVEGYLANKNLRIDIVRQKSAVVGSAWDPFATNNYLPHNLDEFVNLAGFTSNFINPKKFEVLQTKKLRLNSRKSNPILQSGELDADAAMDGDTPVIQYLDFFLPLNKVCKQIQTTTDENAGGDTTTFNPHASDGLQSRGGYAFDNQHPLANIWCIISCDDDTDILTALTQDSASVSCIRRCCWRDRL